MENVGKLMDLILMKFQGKDTKKNWKVSQEKVKDKFL